MIIHLAVLDENLLAVIPLHMAHIFNARKRGVPAWMGDVTDGNLLPKR